MIQKVHYIFLGIISLFLFGLSDVKADNTRYIELNYDSVQFQNYMNNNGIEQKLEFLHNKIIDPNISTHPYYVVYCYAGTLNVLFFEQDTVYLYLRTNDNNSVGSGILFTNYNSTSPFSEKNKVIRFSLSYSNFAFPSVYNGVISSFQSNIDSNTYSDFSLKTLYDTPIDISFPYQYFENGREAFILESSVNIILWNNINNAYSYGIKVNDKIYTEDMSFPAYIDRSSYKFDEDVDDVGVNEFIFEFDTSKFNEQYSFDINYKISSVTGINDNPDLPPNIFEFKGNPYLTYTKDGVTNYTILDTEDDRQFFYENTLAWNFTGIVSDLKLHFPVDETNNARYHITLNSNLPFVLTRILDEEAESSYKTIDLTGKYGAYFTPKLVPNQSEIFSSFYLNGDFSITNRNNYDLSSDSISGYINSYGYDVISFYFDYNDINRNIFFENKKFTSDDTVTIRYDSKYFDCYVVDSQFSNITVVNPNTSEKSDLNFTLEEKMPSEEEEEEKGFFSRFDFFTKPVSFILDGVTMLYEEYLPPSVQNYFYISFGLVVIIIVIRIFF